MKLNLRQKANILRRLSSISLLVVAAVLIETTSVVQYWFARKGIQTEVERRARTEIKLRSLEIENMVSSVEVAVENMRLMLEWAVANPQHIDGVLATVIESNPSISGCAIGFEPNYFRQHGQWFEPFAGRENGAVVHRQIGDEQHDYHKMEWYQQGIQAEGGRWTEPYFDAVGSKALVCSYSIPLRDPSGKVVAVFCSDISLDWLDNLFGHHADAYTFLASRTGHLIACPDKSLVMTTTLQDVAKRYNDSMIDVVNASLLAGDSGEAVIRDNDGKKVYMYYAPVQGNTGWSMSILFPDDVIYRDLNHVAIQLFLFMLIGLLLMVYIMWRTVRGFRKLGAVSAEKERIGSELRIASGIQMGMLPKTFPPYPKRDEVTMFGSIVPAKEVGGDLYDFYIRDEKLFFCLGDVSGKGVPASLVMAVTRSLFRTVSSHEGSPDRIMTQINNAMSEMNESSMFVTLFVGVLNLRTGQVAYCNAGHNPPVLVNANPHFIHQDANIPVGLMSEWGYTLQEGQMEPGDLLFLYTDGLTEAENANHDQFGEERMMETLCHISREPRMMIDGMSKAIHGFVNGAEQSDDLTMLAIKFVHPIKDDASQPAASDAYHITLQNDVQQVPQLAAFVEEVGESLGLTPSTIMNLNLAMEEAVVNVMNYAYPTGTQGDIDITAAHEDGFISFTIQDSGTPFDPTGKEEPDLTLPAEERPIGGLGIMLVRQLMDEVSYDRIDNKNTLTLKKKI